MNENYTDFRFPVIKANPWTKVFSPFTPADAISLISHLLTYTPTQRFGPFDAMAHEVIVCLFGFCHADACCSILMTFGRRTACSRATSRCRRCLTFLAPR